MSTIDHSAGWRRLGHRAGRADRHFQYSIPEIERLAGLEFVAAVAAADTFGQGFESVVLGADGGRRRLVRDPFEALW